MNVQGKAAQSRREEAFIVVRDFKFVYQQTPTFLTLLSLIKDHFCTLPSCSQHFPAILVTAS